MNEQARQKLLRFAKDYGMKPEKSSALLNFKINNVPGIIAVDYSAMEAQAVAAVVTKGLHDELIVEDIIYGSEEIERRIASGAQGPDGCGSGQDESGARSDDEAGRETISLDSAPGAFGRALRGLCDSVPRT